MKRLLNFLYHEDTPEPEQTAPPSNGDRGKLKEQLSSKINKRPSLFRYSFYDREEGFKSLKHTQQVQPRDQGRCQYKQGTLSPKTSAWCKLQSHWLYLCRPESETDTAITTTTAALKAASLKQIDLVGSHLTSNKADEFIIKDAKGKSTHFFFPSAQEHDEWMVALSKVPGLFRRVTDYYILGKTWGHGATCMVQEAVDRFSGKVLAVKSRLENTRDATTAMHHELRILQICAKSPHPAIPKLEDYFFDEDGRVFLVMQLMQGGELFDYIVNHNTDLTELHARQIFKQLVSGVAHLHSLGIAHRDLKPENIMYLQDPTGSNDDDALMMRHRINIMDYDLAKVNYAPEWTTSTPCGTLHYVSPEIIRREQYTQAVDVWSLGVILFILLSGRMPFAGHDDKSVEASILQGKIDMDDDDECWKVVSAEAKDLVKKLLTLDPAARPTAAACCEHPWLLKDDVEISSHHLKTTSTLKEHALIDQVNGRLSTKKLLSVFNVNPPKELSVRGAKAALDVLNLDKMRLEMDLANANNGTNGSKQIQGRRLVDDFVDLPTTKVDDDGYSSSDD